MPSMTPIRIRGKRTATQAEKWRAGGQRKLKRDYSLPTATSLDSDERSTSTLARMAARQSRKRLDAGLSRLEQLPTEMLQGIFEYSLNPDLPIASPRLASQLASGVLHFQVTSKILDQVLGEGRPKELSADVNLAMRLMNSKFFTWSFFRAWLRSQFERLGLAQEWEIEIRQDADLPNVLQQQEQWTWHHLKPSPALPPPPKLLCRPFTENKISFLQLMVACHEHTISPVYGEIVQSGLQQAIEDGASEALESIFSLGAQIDTELLRKAIIDAGCNKDVVHSLITRTSTPNGEPADVDFLDATLWAWADRTRLRGDEKGIWLIDRLQSAARSCGQGEMNRQAK